MLQGRIQDEAQLDFILIRNYKHGAGRKRHFRKVWILKVSLRHLGRNHVFDFDFDDSRVTSQKVAKKLFSFFLLYKKKWGYRVVLGALRMGNNLIR